jgi:hypothetical protein
LRLGVLQERIHLLFSRAFGNHNPLVSSTGVLIDQSDEIANTFQRKEFMVTFTPSGVLLTLYLNC